MRFGLDLVTKTLPRWQDSLNSGTRHGISGQFYSRKAAGTVHVNMCKIPFSVHKILYR
jgi:hypothetical protein